MLRSLLPVMLFGALSWAGCMGPIPPSEQANEAARDLNVNSRFGDVGGLAHMAKPSFRDAFLSRRAEWGNLVRVVDVELAGMTMKDSEHAVVSVDFSWTRVDQGTLQMTRVIQEWDNTDGDWQLSREKRHSGALGLFGEKVAPKARPPRDDVQFATTVIR
jgi:hypothetical protein